MKPKISTRAWVRTLSLSVLAAVLLQGAFNYDEVRDSFKNGFGIPARHPGAQVSTPGYLRLPEMLAGAMGRIWHLFQ